MIFASAFLVLLTTDVCRGGISNNLVDNVEYPQCDLLLKQIPFRKIKAPVPLQTADIEGRWISQKCETRPGLIHMIRSYVFHSDGRLEATAHTFVDNNCAKPKVSVTAEGRIHLARDSMRTPGGTEAEYDIERMSLVVHSHKGFVEVVGELNATTCPSTIIEKIRPQRRTILLESPVSLNAIDVSSISCVPRLFKTWNEFQLFRVEVPHTETMWNSVNGTECEASNLFLGDLHSNPKWQKHYQPTSYQTPLIKTDCLKDCPVCESIAQSSLEAPPMLSKKPRLQPPSLMEGTWASSRCEVQRHGLFLTRKLSFRPSRPRWNLKQRYFSDPMCRHPSYTIAASGTYRRPTATRRLHNDSFDMVVRRMSINPDDKNFAAQLNRIPGRRCGIAGKWRVRKSQDITLTGGCAPIGLKVPSKEPEIFRLEAKDNGQVSLYLGLTPTWPYRGPGLSPRPTAWGPPLTKCNPVSPLEDNQLPPVMGARVALVASSDQVTSHWYLVVALALCNALHR